MTSLRRSQTRISSITLCLTGVAIALLGCGHSNETKKEEPPQATGGGPSSVTAGAGGSATTLGTGQGGNSSGGSTTNSSSGGAAPSGGVANGGSATTDGGTASTESGGTQSTSGGEAPANGGTGDSAGASSNPVGTAGAAGSTVKPGMACESDITCTSAGLLCNKALKQCAQCDKAADCTDKSKRYCDATGTCVASIATGCKTSADCANSSSGKACDVPRGRCVQCAATTDCPASNECVNQACVPYSACTNSLDCTSLVATPVCSEGLTPAKCVQCNAAADCVALGAGQVCSGNQCRAACATGEDCTLGLKCNTSVSPNFCAECATHADCPADKYCSKGACLADVCKTGDQACVNNGLAVCSTDGDGFGTPTPCGTGLTCGVSNSKAVCGDGSPPVDCSVDPGKVDPCKSIPKFVGTQTVDGKGEDFCSIPSFELNFTNAAALNNNKAERSAYTGKAVARVGWSDKFFHAYVEVTGSPVRSSGDVSRVWDGDSVELMITTSNTVTGLTSNDSNALHVQVNDQVAAIIKASADSGSATAITDPNQYKGIKTSTGYAIELKMPWPSGATLAANAAVRFDMTINVDQASVDSNQGRDGQAVLAMATLSGNSTCGGTAPAPFCDDRLWCSTALK